MNFITPVLSQNPEKDSLPVLDGVLGPSAVDVRNLYASHGLLAFDPGFRSTASCKSAITFLDGDKGILLYRGYPIEELAEHSTFEEVAYLLMHGELPNSVFLNSIFARHDISKRRRARKLVCRDPF